jgi:imidazolonepropionase-like amidohydrolase
VFTYLELLKLWCETTPSLIFPKRKIGALRDGYEASVVVLEQDPLQDFASVQRVARRVKQGHLFP